MSLENISQDSAAGRLLLSGAAADYSVALIAVPGNVADGESFTLRHTQAETYAIEHLATDSLLDVIDLNHADAGTVSLSLPQHGLINSQYFAIESEVLQVQSVLDGNTINAFRAKAGTVAAKHEDGKPILVGNGVTPGAIAVPVTALTPAIVTDALAAIISNKSSFATAVGIDDNTVMVRNYQPTASGFVISQPAVFSITSNVADGEAVVISTATTPVITETFEFELLATNSTKVTAGLNNKTDGPLMLTIAGHGLVEGQYFAVESEVFQAVSVADADTVTVNRALAGTAAAAHADGKPILIGNGVTTDAIPVPVATLTPAIATDALVAIVNSKSAIAKATDVSATTITLAGVNADLKITATTTGTSSVSTNVPATTGSGDTLSKGHAVSRVPAATEVLQGKLVIPVNFVPHDAFVRVRVTATGAIKTWDGAVTIDPVNQLVILDNSGSTNWAETDTIHALIF